MPILFLALLFCSERGRSDSDDVTTARFLNSADPSSPPVVSMSQRFVFRGFDRHDGTRLAAWIENVAARIERRFGHPIPFKRFEMIRIEAMTRKQDDVGGLYVGQGMIDRSFQQRVVVANPDQIEEEALLEGIVQVFLNRYAISNRRDQSGTSRGGSVPDWFSVGVAHGIMRPGLRKRYKDMVAKKWKDGAGGLPRELFAMHTLPPGHIEEKAFCGAFVAWLEVTIPKDQLWMHLPRRFAEQKPVDLSWLTSLLPGVNSERDVNKAWDLWVAHESKETPRFGALSFKQVVALKEKLDIRLIDFGLAPAEGESSRISPQDLIDHRRDPWARGIALQLAREMRDLGIGSAPELVEVAEKYARYFDAFGKKNEGILSARLEEAEQALNRLEKQVAQRADYMESLEEREWSVSHAVEEGVSQKEPGVMDLQKSFLDRIEERRK